MAKIPQGILGGIRGRVGNIVGGAWKGINYIRSMPLSVANPNTTLQQAQRGAFTQVVLTARLLLANLIATYWDPFARAMSGYNHFISINIDAFTTAGFTTFADFFSSRGILTGVVNLVGAFSVGGTSIDWTWTDNSGSGDALATDLVVTLYYNEDQGYWQFHDAGAIDREDAAKASTDTRMELGDTLHGYVFFIRPDLSKISDSAYFTGDVAA